MRKSTRQLIAEAERILGIRIFSEGSRAWYRAPETGEGYWLSRDDLSLARDVADESDPYCAWCAVTGRRMAARTLRRLLGE